MLPKARRRRGAGAGAAAVEEQSSSEDTPEVEPHSKQNKTGPKKGDKSATAAALEELESWNHAVDSISKNPAPTKAGPTLQQDSREPDATSERVREMERRRREKEAQEAQEAEIQRLAAENQQLKRKLNLAPSAESKPTKATKPRKCNSQRREKVVNSVFVMWVLSVIIRMI